MKQLLLIVPLLFLLLSCKKDEVIMNDSTELQQQSAWKSEKFKWDYTIQFPRYYDGGYMQGFEGGTFDKLRDDTRTHFFYSYTNGLQYFDFGDTLVDETIDSISVGDMLTILPFVLISPKTDKQLVFYFTMMYGPSVPVFCIGKTTAFLKMRFAYHMPMIGRMKC